MKNVSNVGRIFYGIAIIVLGCQAMYVHEFPYMLIPMKHSWIPGLTVVTFIFGSMLVLAGACIVVKKQGRSPSLMLGSILLLIFCFYYLPYEFFFTSKYMHLVEWDSALKELSLSAGAFVIAGCFDETNKNAFISFLGKMIPAGAILFSIVMISFGILHFQVAEGLVDYIPSWIPFRLFWAYFAGAALIGSGLAIIFKIRVGLFALLLGVMIFSWFMILHIPRVIASPPAYLTSEITSAFIALAYSGIALVIAGHRKPIGH